MGNFQNVLAVEAEMRNNFSNVRIALEKLYTNEELVKIEQAILPVRTDEDHLAALMAAKANLEIEGATDALAALEPYIKVHEDAIAAAAQASKNQGNSGVVDATPQGKPVGVGK